MRVSGAVSLNPDRQVAAGEPIEVYRAPRYVSRGGEKLHAALETFAIPVQGRIAVDAGSSTGGFTDCLLQAGAIHVHAVDVGTNQLHERLRGDPRVTTWEQTRIQDLEVEAVGGPVEIVVADLSFTSLAALVPRLIGFVARDGDLVVLCKPQFEATRAEADRGGGVIRDPSIWARVLREVQSALEGHGAGIMEAMVSPVRGRRGNVEFLLHIRRADARGSRHGVTGEWIDELLAEFDR